MAGSGSVFLDAITALLVSRGIVQDTNSAQDWMVFYDFFEDAEPTKDRAVSITLLPGGAPDPAWNVVYPNVQIRVRGGRDESQLARQKIQDIFECLHGADAAISPPVVYFYAVQSAALQMGRDNQRRPHYSWNFRSMASTPTSSS